MFRTALMASAVLAFTSATMAIAQTVPAPGAVVMSAPDPNILRAGTQIQLKMSEALTTKGKTLRVGYRFNLEVAEPVLLNDQIVIPVGSPAIGEVTDVRNKGMWGKSGAINAHVVSLRANGRQIRISGAINDKGVTGTGGVVAAIAFLPVAGFFTTGTSAQFPIGMPVKAFLDEDIVVAFAAPSAPAPMTVPKPPGN